MHVRKVLAATVFVAATMLFALSAHAVNYKLRAEQLDTNAALGNLGSPGFGVLPFSLTPVSTGSGYAVGDTIVLVCPGRTFASGRAPKVNVNSASPFGAHVVDPGVAISGSMAPATCTQASTTNQSGAAGAGSGSTFNVVFGFIAAYVAQPDLYSGGSTSAGTNGNTFSFNGNPNPKFSGQESTFYGSYAGDAFVGASFGDTAFGEDACGGDQGNFTDSGPGANTCIGNDAGRNIQGTAYWDLLIGQNAGRNMTGNNNVAIGNGVLQNDAGGSQNTGTGHNALNALTTANYATAYGFYALAALTTGPNNSAFGANALVSTTTGANNSAFGLNSLYANTTGAGNTAFGYAAMISETTGSDNDGFGQDALFALTTGSRNSAFGNYALAGETTGNQNTAVGQGALQSQNGVSYATAVGFYALHSNTSGNINTAFGANALFANTTGNFNTALGENALYANTVGALNVAAGIASLQNLTSGSNNTAIGSNTAAGLTTGNNNTVLGANVSGLSASLSDAIILATGEGTVRADFGATNAGGWTLAGNAFLTKPTLTSAVAGSDGLIVQSPGSSNFLTFKPEAATNSVNEGYWIGGSWGTVVNLGSYSAVNITAQKVSASTTTAGADGLVVQASGSPNYLTVKPESAANTVTEGYSTGGTFGTIVNPGNYSAVNIATQKVNVTTSGAGADGFVVQAGGSSNFLTFKPESATNQVVFGYWIGGSWGVVKNSGTFDAAGYSVAGTAGVTGTTCTAWTNGICTHL